MSESQTPVLLTTLEQWRLPQSVPPMWRYIWKRGNGTVIRTWETESALSSLLPSSLLYDEVGLSSTPAEASAETPNDRGDAT
jgi:hypothetical protein